MNRSARLKRSQSCTTPCGLEDHSEVEQSRRDLHSESLAEKEVYENEICNVRYRSFQNEDDSETGNIGVIGRRRCQSFDISKLREKVK